MTPGGTLRSSSRAQTASARSLAGVGSAAALRSSPRTSELASWMRAHFASPTNTGVRAATKPDRVYLNGAVRVPPRSDCHDVGGKRRTNERAQMPAKGLLPRPSHRVVERGYERLGHCVAKPALDLGAVRFDVREPEREVVVGDAVQAPLRATFVLRHRNEPLDQPQLDQPVQGPRGLSADGVGDLAVLGTSRRNRAQDAAAHVAQVGFGRE